MHPLARSKSLGVSIALLVATAANLSLGIPAAHAQNGFDISEMVGPAGSGRYGEHVVVLSNGNYAVSDSLFDGPNAANIGAVYLYDGATNVLISRLTGSAPNDLVGSNGLTVVGGGNVVVSSPMVTIAGVPFAGAVTWIDGVSGLQGSVSAANSLVGSTPGDAVGNGEVARLSNGNYVVASPQWSNGPFVPNAGAVTWGSGSAGVRGAVSGANSQIGAVPEARAGKDDVIALTNGNYVSYNDDMPVGTRARAGAVTWGNGATGSVGTISAANSLIGGTDNDGVGSGRVTPLTNGNYVVASPDVDAGGRVDSGAATWGNGTTGTAGLVTTARSLIGATAGAFIASDGVVALANGNYVVASSEWANGAIAAAGAVTWGDGAVGSSATVSAANSLVGTHIDDRVGWWVVPLTNGNYLSVTELWDNGAVADVGAVTWRSGTGVSSGVVSATNSLVGGIAGARVGYEAVALTNGNAVIGSPGATIGGLSAAGAATWISGSAVTAATVSAANSLVGMHADDRVGGEVAALANGNYVVLSSSAQIGAVPRAGAVTSGNGTTGTTGVVSAANSLVGASTDDFVGADGITVLADGNYVVTSRSWNNGAAADVGAVTWRSATSPITGVVSAANSTYGSKANDGALIDDPVPTAGGGFLVTFRTADSPSATSAGATVYAAGGGSPGAVGTSDRAVFGQMTNGGDGMRSVGERTTAKAIFVSRPDENIVTRIDDIDTSPPVFTTTPANITAATAPGGTNAAVTFTAPMAVDNILAPTVSCSPASGSTFPIGVTNVVCIAADRAGLQSTTTFDVTVTATPPAPGPGPGGGSGGGGGGSGGGGGGGGGGGAAAVDDFVPLVPARLVDTRAGQETTDGQLAAGGVVPGGTTLTVAVAGRGGVAADASAAALNVTAVLPVANAFVTVFPCGSPLPNASNLNVDAAAVAPNTVLAKVGAGGAVCVYVSQTMHLVVDVNGYFPATSTYVPANPQRVLDSRVGEQTADARQQGGGVIPAGTTTELQISGRVGVPVDASSVALNVTVTGAQGSGFVTVYPCGAGRPTASSLNASGSDVANLVITSIGAGGAVCLFNQVAIHLVADVNGWFPASTTYAPLTPDRLLDTRGNAGLPVAARSITELRVAGVRTVPAGVGTVVLNVTVTEPAGAGFVTVFPCGVDQPLASNLNFAAGQTVPNAVVVKVGANGSVCLYSSQAAHLVVDVNGSFPA